MSETSKSMYFVIALALIVTAATIATADRLDPRTPEIQGLSTATSVNALGTVTETDAMAWQTSNYGLSNTTLAAPGHAILVPGTSWFLDIPAIYFALDDTPGEVRSTVGYNENTAAVNGAVTYVKGSAVNTGNQLADQFNVKNSKTVTFTAADTGRMTSSEDLLMDNVGTFDYTRNNVLCPFASTASTFIPEFCNIVTESSAVDMSQVSLATAASERSVAATSDIPAEADYSIQVHGIGNSPAIGSAQTSMNVHIQEGRTGLLAVFPFSDTDAAYLYTRAKGEDVAYTETSSASGAIAQFSKSMNYQSGMLAF